MRGFIAGLFLLSGCCYNDMNLQYCGIINQGMTDPVVVKAKSDECDIVLVDSCGIVLGIPGQYPVAKALCASLSVGDTLTTRVEDLKGDE